MKREKVFMRVAELKNSNSLAPFYIIKGRDAYLRRMAMDYFKSLCPPEYIDFNFSVFSLTDGIEKILDSVHTALSSSTEWGAEFWKATFWLLKNIFLCPTRARF